MTEFLLARIAEDEAQAHETWEDYHPDGPEAGTWYQWVLAECDAKRRIVERSDRPVAHAGQDIERRAVLALLALPYADHTDYRQEWKP